MIFNVAVNLEGTSAIQNMKSTNPTHLIAEDATSGNKQMQKLYK